MPGSSPRPASRASTLCASASRIDGSDDTVLDLEAEDSADPASAADDPVEDDRLRLVFTCCHPALAAGRAGRDDAARSLRTHDRGNRQRVPDSGTDAGAADRARQGENPRCPHPVRGAGRGRTARAARCRAARRLPGLQRGLCGLQRATTLARARPIRRGDPPRAAADRAAAGTGSRRPARVDAAAGFAPRRADLDRRRHRAARRAGPFAVESRRDRGGTQARPRARSPRAASGRTRCRRRSPPSTPRRATPDATDWGRIVATYDVLLAGRALSR